MARCSTLTSGRRPAALGALVASMLLAACGATGPAPSVVHDALPTPTRPASATPPVKHPKPDPIAVEQALLDTRAEGIRTHDLDLFLSGDDPRQPAFLTRDRAYFAAASAVPWKVFQYQVTATPWPQQLLDPTWGKAVRLPEVVFNTQIGGFDPEVVTRTTGFAFVTRKGRTYIASDQTVHGHLFPGYQPDPWDVEAVTVTRTPNIIGVFDRAAAQKAAEVMAMLRRAIGGVSSDLPYPWDKKVVLYALTGSAFSSAFTAASGGDVTHLGAVTYPVDPSVPEGDRRILLLGDALEGTSGPLAQIIRHEVTHIALGFRNDNIPLWLVEGIAEYEGAKAVPADQRQIAESAIRRAARPPQGMPTTANFHNADQDWHYALSWMACEFIVRKGGQSLLWTLLDAMNNSGAGTTDATQNPILEQVLGMNSAQLAVHAAELIRSTYG